MFRGIAGVADAHTFEFMKTAPRGHKLAKRRGNARIILRFHSLAVETGNASRALEATAISLAAARGVKLFF